MHTTTIAAIATAPGRGGIGVVRVSGPLCQTIAQRILGQIPPPRHALYGPFKDADGTILDQGIALYFPGPHSFTGEDVLELQGHGGPVILDMLLKALLACGAKPAKPGEFSERAFLNDKLDLTQAEAIADLIEASSEQAARQAVNALQGAFSKEVQQLVEDLIALRIYVEAAIDFPEEEVDFLGDGKIAAHLAHILEQLQRVTDTAQQGQILRDGMNVVLIGRPNAGKSSLLNTLVGRDTAIVTPVAGTTRDVLREHIHIDGMPLHIFDTAGLRETSDTVEQIGIARAWQAIDKADRLLLLIDATQIPDLHAQPDWQALLQPPLSSKLTLIYNKIDCLEDTDSLPDTGYPTLRLSAATGAGLDTLKQHLKSVMSYEGTTEGGFSARRRHLEALEQARLSLISGQTQLQTSAAGELLAEDLRQAQNHLGEITGTFTPDDLLGRIFTSFCIGK